MMIKWNYKHYRKKLTHETFCLPFRNRPKRRCGIFPRPPRGSQIWSTPPHKTRPPASEKSPGMIQRNPLPCTDFKMYLPTCLYFCVFHKAEVFHHWKDYETFVRRRGKNMSNGCETPTHIPKSRREKNHVQWLWNPCFFVFFRISQQLFFQIVVYIVKCKGCNIQSVYVNLHQPLMHRCW